MKKDGFRYNLQNLRHSMPSSLFNSNWNLLQSIDPLLAEHLSILSTKIPDHQDIQHDIDQEAFIWFQGLTLEGIEVLYVYGIGSGHNYIAAQAWLKQHSHHRLIFLEDQLTSIYALLESTLGTLILEDSQVDLKDISSFEQNFQVIYDIVAENTLRPYLVTASSLYERERSERFMLLKDQISFENTEQNAKDKELAHFGIAFFNNFYQNLLDLPQAYDAQGLKDKFKDIPAIISGAGPSLLKQIPLLKQLQSQALLFAPGSSMNILNSQGVEPHFGVNIDPFPETFHRQMMNRAFETPFFYLQRIYHEALEAIHGPRLWLAGGTFYNTTAWFEQELKLPIPFLKGGYNVVSTTVELASYLGCNPIIFVGMDLSFTPGQHYASGIERHPLFPGNPSQTHMGAPLSIKDQSGRSVQTYWIWVIEAHWIDAFHRDHPNQTLLNATEGGFGLFSVPNCPLEEIVKRYRDTSYPLDEKIHQSIQQAGLIPITLEQVQDCLTTFYESLKRCYQLCEMLYQEEGNELNKTQLEKELAFEYCLSQFHEFYLKFTHRDRRLIQRLPKEEQNIRLKQLEQEHYAFLIKVLLIQLKLIETALETKIESVSSSPSSISKCTNSSLESKIFHYLSGSLYSCQTYRNGLKQGKHLYYYPKGALKSEIHYQEGVLDGPTRLYYPSGQLKRELFFKQGKRQGKERSWYANGQLFTEVDYKENVSIEARAWSATGQLVKEIKAI